jgi:hypothetical protein
MPSARLPMISIAKCAIRGAIIIDRSASKSTYCLKVELLKEIALRSPFCFLPLVQMCGLIEQINCAAA